MGERESEHETPDETGPHRDPLDLRGVRDPNRQVPGLRGPPEEHGGAARPRTGIHEDGELTLVAARDDEPPRRTPHWLG